ncbi:MAG: type II toxin-antitoxin system PemK/MazF family toxin [Thermodesulfobacteriota bacterium]
MGMVINRFEVYLVNLDPTVGSEIKKTRPAVIISPDEINYNLNTVIIAPMTTGGKNYPSRITCEFKGKTGKIVLDQLRTVDKIRLIKKVGSISRITQDHLCDLLCKLFQK